MKTLSINAIASLAIKAATARAAAARARSRACDPEGKY